MLTTTCFQISIFPTELGWFGLIGRENMLDSLSIGHLSRDQVRRHFNRSQEMSRWDHAEQMDWNAELRQKLQRFARGEKISFQGIRTISPSHTNFQKAILKTVKRIPYGKTLSYGEVAAKAGYPRAARAVGSVMASNRTPIIVPCHRVVASGQKIGGFSTPQGILLKRRMLELENIQI